MFKVRGVQSNITWVFIFVMRSSLSGPHLTSFLQYHGWPPGKLAHRQNCNTVSSSYNTSLFMLLSVCANPPPAAA